MKTSPELLRVWKLNANEIQKKNEVFGTTFSKGWIWHNLF